MNSYPRRGVLTRTVRLLGVVLGCVSGFALGEEWVPLNADMASPFEQLSSSPLQLPHIATTETQAALQLPLTSTKPPKFAVLDAAAMSWNHDRTPDGWLAKIQLFDETARVVVPSKAYATFELQLKVPRRDRNGFQNVHHKPIRWSTLLEFTDSGVATARLPLRVRLPALPDDNGSPPRLTSHRNQLYEIAEQSGRFGTTQRLKSYPQNALVQPTVRYGVLRVRISIPSVNVLEAMDLVATEESALLDTD